MKLKSVSGYVCYVKDLDTTAKFYQDIGFLLSKREEKSVSFRLNWFFVEFRLQDKEIEAKGEGVFIYNSVEDVDDFHNHLISKGFKLTSEPQDRNGNREFDLKDPDGYNLVFFKRK